jgi:hypothetical protein
MHFPPVNLPDLAADTSHFTPALKDGGVLDHPASASFLRRYPA